MIGTVAFFDVKRGVGWIQPDENDQRIGPQGLFVHYKQIVGDGFRKLERGQRVRFEIGSDKASRMCAVDVEVVG